MESDEALFTELCTITKMTPEKWERIKGAPREVQRLELANYADQDWTDPSTPVGQRVLTILGILGMIGGDISGVAGAGTAVANLRNL